MIPQDFINRASNTILNVSLPEAKQIASYCICLKIITGGIKYCA